MAVAQVCPKIRCKIFLETSSASTFYDVRLLGNTLARFPRFSPARTFARRVDTMFRWLGQSVEVFPAEFGAGIQDFLAKAGSGDGTYRPPLTLV
jgi:hypothetical protein